ncbi:MAG: MFS transporter [Planctomycetes bacterium]|nr:MFS transporter [Planctomycetota bacterium]
MSAAPAPRRRASLREHFASGALGPNVPALGLVSLFTDISSEMVSAILPLWLLRELQFSTLEFGALDGVWRGFGGVLGALVAFAGDRGRKHRLAALAGYALSTASRAALLVLPIAWATVAGALLADRAGKGLRTPSRDALISFASRPEARASAFGLHRALDAVGWLLGPVIAFAILALAPGAFDAVLFTSVAFGLLGLACMALLVVDEEPRGERAPEPVHSNRGELARVWSDRGLRRILLVVSALGIASVGEMLVVAALDRRGLVPPERLPLCFTLLALVQVLLAVPCARVAERVGLARAFVGAHALLVAVYVLLAAFDAGAALPWAALFFVGVFLAATDGVLAALVTRASPPERRGTALALVLGASGAAKACASLGFGALWQARGLETSFVVFAALAAVGMLVAAMSVRAIEEVGRGD